MELTRFWLHDASENDRSPASRGHSQGDAPLVLQGSRSTHVPAMCFAEDRSIHLLSWHSACWVQCNHCTWSLANSAVCRQLHTVDFIRSSVKKLFDRSIISYHRFLAEIATSSLPLLGPADAVVVDGLMLAILGFDSLCPFRLPNACNIDMLQDAIHVLFREKGGSYKYIGNVHSFGEFSVL